MVRERRRLVSLYGVTGNMIARLSLPGMENILKDSRQKAKGFVNCLVFA